MGTSAVTSLIPFWVDELDRSCIERFIRAILEVFPGRVETIVLYGSIARGDFTEESDIDLFVRIRDTAPWLSKEDGLLFSETKLRILYDEGYPEPIHEFRPLGFGPEGGSPDFLANVKKDGIVLWGKELAEIRK